MRRRGLVLGGLVSAWALAAPALFAQAAADGERAPDAAMPAAVSGANADAASAPPLPSAAPVASPGPSGATLGEYQALLAQRKLGTFAALSSERLREIVAEAEAQLVAGRRDEAIGTLSALVESPRFVPFRALDDGRAALFLLGDALGRAGAYSAARVYLVELLGAPSIDTWSRQAVRSLVDFGLKSDDPALFYADVQRFGSVPMAEIAGDVQYLAGTAHEAAGRSNDARDAYLRVAPNSRYWAQATYRAGLLEVDQRRFKEGEQLFCRVADPKQTPRLAPLFGGNDFFVTRDLSRLALGRIAHEQYRFDDARYYYHLVPNDSERLPEALYEAATSRYEAKDYESAHQLLAELRALDRPHAYADEAWILDAYVDLARCEFPAAAAKLDEFLKRYEPVRDAAHKLASDPRALRALLEPSTESQGSLGLGVPEPVRRILAESIQVDPTYGSVSRQLADLEHQLGGIGPARAELASIGGSVAGGSAAQARMAQPMVDTPRDRAARLGEQLGATRRLLREAGAAGTRDAQTLGALRQELATLEAEAAQLGEQSAEPEASEPSGADAFASLLGRDDAQARALASEASALRESLEATQNALAVDALQRLEQRLTRLIRRARAGRVETVLGKKHAIEIEVEALSQGYLPEGAVDSLEAARYLKDDEEYWPFDGEDWDDEYIGGEGLR
jgi:hypothetical protein